ncbi:PadR family transcriptional regulator [Gordonia hydrophobica]|uniref:PadR family transcriptional regulator n=1 Tax=Gordonia hydrophobica TaxID=40516 RepID=A0ABZ2U569_9ACTN|nr:PadR family transcriptional regulator [Gordonia hydrophobica]MBM7368658.1 DNA-binding PadR family transcriptional regulator [Gordonia hydrophobica]
MALRDAILAALANEEASGYDLAKAFDVTVANYWTATPQQMYRELDKLDAAGLVEGRVVRQAKRPDKRIFSLTDAGRDALHEYTCSEPKPTAIRDELLVQVEALDSGDPGAVRENVVRKKIAAQTKLAHYHRTRDYLLDGRTEEQHLAESPRVGPYLTLRRGILFEEENIAWCDFVLETLDARSPESRSAG